MISSEVVAVHRPHFVLSSPAPHRRKGTLNEWEVRSMKGQDEVSNGEKWQVTKLGEAKMKDLSCECW